MILSSLIPPTTLTLTAAFFLSYSAATFLNSLSSRALQPTHTVSVVGGRAGLRRGCGRRRILRHGRSGDRNERKCREQDDYRRHAFHLSPPLECPDVIASLSLPAQAAAAGRLVNFPNATLNFLRPGSQVCWDCPRKTSKVLDQMPPAAAAIPPLLKDLNERTVLETIRAGAPISRAEISRRAGISKPTVSLALQSLLEAGLVQETEPDPGRPTYGAIFFDLVPEAALVLGLDLGARFLRGAICDLRGEVRARQDVELDGADADAAIEAIGVPPRLARRVVRALRRADRRCGRRRPRRRRRGHRPAPARDERPRPRGTALGRRHSRPAGSPGRRRERHQPGGRRRALAGRGARGGGLRVPLGRYRPRRRAHPPGRAASRSPRRGRRGRPGRGRP